MSSELSRMRVPFPDHQISILCRPTSKENTKGRCKVCNGFHGLPAVQLSYVGHAALTDRLLDVDPNWTWEPLAMNDMGVPYLDENGGMWIRLTVCGVSRLGYGDAQGKKGGDAMKERIGDALRNAAMRLGAALDLWHKGELHADNDADANTPIVIQAPKAPLPVNYLGAAEIDEVTRMAHLAGKTLEEIAKAMGVSGIEKIPMLKFAAIKARLIKIIDENAAKEAPPTEKSE